MSGSSTKPRWAARLAITAAMAAVVLPLVAEGLRSLGLAAVALTGLAVSAAGMWWALSRKDWFDIRLGLLLDGIG
nr:hypothetical protein OG999_08530 [Streptomyces sp. NBC_00886]